MHKVDLNCDMGESFGLYELGNDEEMMQYITSANIACGFHGGDPHVMRKTVELAKRYGVGIGAHPAFPDLLGFGRRYMTCTAAEVKDYVTYQLGALREFAVAANIKIQHCKPHGALYMKAMEDKALARAILEAIAEVDQQTVIFALNNSAVLEEAKKMGIPVAREAYADREHTTTGSIILTRKGSQIKDYHEMAQRVVRMVKEGKVMTHDGEEIAIQADTICIHGDTPGASQLAKTIVEALRENGVQIAPIREVLNVGC
ncbi:LamB/YcsF family protein [Aneurinibacillus thermoaerophilus]|uniref:5-oxoprolinase subunit A n=1 Tax=Aneurinibacillus thermoaerophilus TaxID=143495 RepID=A0ABX8Y6U8_ANETH|nr:5-oxoprolinase subunit PxpA [Aneurinibacillus thermoaerophilus]MED0737584.1 5-oxoprolinase subunit PxpA [Aneurinibacillus thermoaerophilus]MED0758155.1 5-oxoprolinase subunit PxpA [Aneurinibacillus thermoaerophilus]MED0761309.1 5-oxoprolinase subunit PxpA [Aneurinibacillus thermoaerophilus]QYY41337.1 LamB/YcsF family protein [Aneurinibacillus thermoaerophilus]